MSAQGELFRAHAHIRPRRANFFAHEVRQRDDVETNDTNARPQQGSLETGITSAPEKCTKNTHFAPAKATAVSVEARPAPAKAMAVSVEARPAPAKAMTVSYKRPSWSTGPDCGAGGRWRGLAGQRGDAPNRTPAHQAPRVWRAPEGPAAVPVGGGRAWPGFETTRRAKLAARTASGRAAAHRHTQRPGPPAPGTPVGPQAARPSRQPTTTRTLRPRRAARAGTGRGSG